MEENNLRVKLTNGHEYKFSYEYILNMDAPVINYYKEQYPKQYNNVNLVLPAFFSNAYGNTLEEVELPGTVVTLQGCAFKNCTNLKNVKLNSGLQNLFNHAFCNCSSLTEIEIPNTVKVIQNTFYNCPNLKVVKFEAVPVIPEIPKSRMTVKEAIESVAIFDNSVDNLFAFENCENLEEIDISNYPRFVRNAFYNCPKIRRIKLNVDEKKDRKVEIALDENEQFYDIQKEKDSVVILTKKEGKICSRLINTTKSLIKKYDFEVVLNSKGNAVRAYKYFSDISDEDLKTNKYMAVFGDDFFSEEFIYSQEDIRKINKKIQEIKEEVLSDSQGLSQKELYARLVISLSHRLEYDFAGLGIKLGALGQVGELSSVIADCQSTTKMSYDDYIMSKIGISPRLLFTNPDNVQKILNVIKDFRCNSRSARGLVTGRTICYSNPEIIRNIAHELGIESKYYSGLGHSWNQVFLDGEWYDDDFTLYNEAIRNQEFDSKVVRNTFLRGYSVVDGERKREFLTDEKHKCRSTRPLGEEVTDSIDPSYSAKILGDATKHYDNVTQKINR